MGENGATRSVWRLFWAWQDEKEAAWLRQMARSGWHLRRAALVRFTFDRGAPADVVYRLDYRPVPARDLPEYLGLFRAAGWEHVGEVANWHYFRTSAAAGSDPDIFSDTESRVAKYRRLLAFAAMCFALLLPGMSNVLDRLDRAAPGVAGRGYLAILTVQVAAALLLGYAAVRLALLIRRLRRGTGAGAGSSS